MWLIWKARTSGILLCMDAQHTKHLTYKLAYHFIWYPTYRKGILTGKIATFVKQERRPLCSVGALHVREDHMLVFLSVSRLLLPHRSHML